MDRILVLIKKRVGKHHGLRKRPIAVRDPKKMNYMFKYLRGEIQGHWTAACVMGTWSHFVNLEVPSMETRTVVRSLIAL